MGERQIQLPSSISRLQKNDTMAHLIRHLVNVKFANWMNSNYPECTIVKHKDNVINHNTILIYVVGVTFEDPLTMEQSCNY